MCRSAVVLAGGFSRRFGVDKGVLELGGKSLVGHVVDAVGCVVDEVIVVTSSVERVARYGEFVSGGVRFAVDVCDLRSPLIGALSGFGVARGEYCVLLPFDTPFVSRDVVSLLFEVGLGRSAAIPRWPNCQIEPLHAVYRREEALKAAEDAVAEGKLNVRAMIDKLRCVRYVSTMVLQQLDPELHTFFNINTPADLKKARTMVKTRKHE